MDSLFNIDTEGAAKNVALDPALMRKLEELARVDLNSVIDKARQGDVQACKVILGMHQLKTLPSSALPEVIEMYAAHIKDSCPPEKADSSDSALAKISFMSLLGALVTFQPDMEDLSLLLRPILQAWPSFLGWARVAFIQDIQATAHFSKNKIFLLAVFLQTIPRLYRSPELQLAAMDPRMLELVMHLYLHQEDADMSCIDTCMEYFSFYIKSSTAPRDASLIVSRRKALDDILSAAHDDPEVLLNPILTLSNETVVSPKVLDTLRIAAALLGNIVSIQNHTIAVALREKGLPSMSKILGLLTGSHPATQHTPLSIGIFLSFLAVFSFMSSPEHGTAWLIGALQYPIFHLIAASCSLFPKSTLQPFDALRPLIRWLTANLIDPSFIFALEKGLSTLSSDEHDQIMSSAVSPEWKAFIDRFFEQYVFYCYFELAGCHKGCYKCGSAARAENKSLRKCTACKNVEYCSSDCQTSDWKDHKMECKRLRDRKNGPLPKWATPLFRRSLAEHDARRHLPGIRALAALHYPCFPLQTLCARIEYVRITPELTVFPMSEISIAHAYDTLEERPLEPKVRFDDVRLQDGSIGIFATDDSVDGEVETIFQKFRWTGPYFSSKYGTLCPDMFERTSFFTRYMYREGKGKREHATTWSVVDELAYRGGLSPQTILEGKMGGIRRKVLEIVVREKARMRVVNGITIGP